MAVKMNIKSMGESHRCALLNIRFDLFFIDRRLVLVRGQHHDNISPDDDIHGLTAIPAAFAFAAEEEPSRRPTQTLNTGILQVICMCMAL